jgi:hypothetical protein
LPTFSYSWIWFLFCSRCSGLTYVFKRNIASHMNALVAHDKWQWERMVLLVVKAVDTELFAERDNMWQRSRSFQDPPFPFLQISFLCVSVNDFWGFMRQGLSSFSNLLKMEQMWGLAWPSAGSPLSSNLQMLIVGVT